jgi:hypothetical protein
LIFIKFHIDVIPLEAMPGFIHSVIAAWRTNEFVKWKRLYINEVMYGGHNPLCFGSAAHFRPWREIESVGTAAASEPAIPAPDDRREHCWNDNWQGKPEVLGEKSAAVPLAHHIFKMDCSGNINL